MRAALPLVFLGLLALPPTPSAVYGGAAACQDGTPYTYFNLETTQVDGSCHLIFGDPIPGFDMVKVVLLTAPVATIRFSLPDPPFGTVTDETWNYPFTGDRVNGMEMSLGGCPSGHVVLGTITIISETGVGGCLQWKVDDGCEAEDCDGVLRPSVAQSFNISDVGVTCDACFQQCQSLPPYDLYPPDGATEVPTNVAFSWMGSPAVPDPSLERYIRISTDSACNTGQTVVVPSDADSISVDFLQPSTTYYWQAGWRYLFGSGCSSGDSGESAIQSFTTSSTVATQPTTWSHVKALYRK